MTLIHNICSSPIVDGIERLEIYTLTKSSLLHRLPFCTSVKPSSSVMGFDFAGLCTSSVASTSAGINCGAASSSSFPSSPLSSSSQSSPSSSPSTSCTSTFLPLTPSAILSHPLTTSSPAPHSATTSAATASTLPSSNEASNSSSSACASISATYSASGVADLFFPCACA